MTHDHDPARWTSSPEEAPDVLRSAFTAARNEGPNRAQLRALAVKLAAASAGGAVAVGTVKAASLGNTVASAAGWSAAKIASVIALAGSVVTGAVVWQQASTPGGSTAERAREGVAARATEAPSPQAESEVAAQPHTAATPAAPTGGATPGAPVPGPETTAPVVEELALAKEAPEDAARTRQAARAPGRKADSQAAQRKPSAVLKQSAVPARTQQPKVRVGSVTRGSTKAAVQRQASRAGDGKHSGTTAAPSVQGKPGDAVNAPAVRGTTAESAAEETTELQLLQSAQAALRARPREAFQLTQRHRRLHPDGEFAQERDALAIQALMRAGETESARELAEAFIRSYPSSPHAHRFREAMGIR